MATIGELVEKYSKVPGDIRVRASSWRPDEWFQPFFSTKGGVWLGLDAEGIGLAYTPDYGDGTWQIYEDPKPNAKVKKWLWAYEMGITGPTWYLTNTRLTAQEADSQFAAWPHEKIEGSAREYPANLEGQEPDVKTKVKRWLWAPKFGTKWTMGGVFMTDHEAQTYRKQHLIIDNFRKVLWSEMEFDE
jgi:hypothetical protein